MIDNGIAIKWDVTDAVRRAKAMEEYDLAWIEEPLGAWDPEGCANLRDRRRSRPSRRYHGLQEGDRPLRVLPPAGQRPRVVLGDRDGARLAISFNSPSCKLFELKPLRNPMQHDLVTRPFAHVDGWTYPPKGSGLGIEVIEEVVDRYRSEKAPSP